MLTIQQYNEQNNDNISIGLQGTTLTMDKKDFLQMAVDIIIAERRMTSYKGLPHE